MSAALLEAPPAMSCEAPQRRSPGGRRITLEERLQGAWRIAQRDGMAECPVCRAGMSADGPHARCRGCGSVLS